jgi:hypothetical protein
MTPELEKLKKTTESINEKDVSERIAGSKPKKPVRNRTGFFLNLDPATSYFPTTESCSIIGSNRLNFRVRDGNGCDPVDKITGKPVER